MLKEKCNIYETEETEGGSLAPRLGCTGLRDGEAGWSAPREAGWEADTPRPGTTLNPHLLLPR